MKKSKKTRWHTIKAIPYSMHACIDKMHARSLYSCMLEGQVNYVMYSINEI